MTELELIDFCEYGVKLEWYDDSLFIGMEFYTLSRFTELVGPTYLSDGGIEVRLQQDCVVFELNDICEYFGINLEKIHKK